MARYWSDGYKSTEQVGSPAETTVTMVDRVRWDNKQDPLVFDDHPVLGSESPVTSDGIARAMLQLQDFVKQKDVELCYIDVVTQADEAVLRDKTYIDIRDAYNNSKTLILRFVDSDDKCAYFYDFQGNVFRFVMFEVTDVLNMYTYWISPDDLLHTEQYSAPYKRPNPEVLSITYGDTSVKYDGSKHASINIPKVPAWALGDTKPKYDASEVGAEAKGVAASRVNAHNNSDTAHADIRNLIANAVNMFNMYATIAQLNSVAQTVQGYASAVQTLRQDAVLHTEVVDDMYTNNSRMPLSAKQGMLLRTMYDALKPVHVGVTMWNGNNVDTIPYYSTVPLANAVPCTDGGGRLSTNSPVDALHCANKKYVDDAILSSVVITEKAEGQIPVIADCAAVPPINIKLFGKGKQNVIAGNQLFDISKVVGHSTNVSSVEVLGNCIKIVMPEGYSGSGYTALTCTLAELCPKLVAGKTYTLSATVNSTGTMPADNKKIYAGFGWMFGSSVTVTEAMLKEKVTLYGSTNAGTTTISDIMINEGTTVKPCEKYVGGEQSPNMNYPQKVESHGESGSIVGKVLTKNFWNNDIINDKSNGIPNTPYAGWYSFPVYVGKGNIVTVSYDDTLPIELGFYSQLILGDLKKWLYYSSGSSVYVNTYTGTSTEDYMYIAISGDYDAFTQYLGSKLQIEISPTKTDYEPYAEQPFTSITPNGLRGIPLGQTIPDAIKNSPIHMGGVYWDNAEQQYYISDYIDYRNKKRIKTIVDIIIDGGQPNNTGWIVYGKNDFYGFSRHCLPFVGDRRSGFCNQASVRTAQTGLVSDNGMWLGVNNAGVYLIHNSFFDASLEDYGLSNLLAHLNENPLIITTWSDDAIAIDLTEEEIAQYNALVMNYPNTTIVNDAGAYMEVEYVADPKLFITNNYVDKAQHDALAARVLVLEQHVINS